MTDSSFPILRFRSIADFSIRAGFDGGNDSNALRNDPLFKLATGRAPLSAGNKLASGPTFSRLEASMTRKDIYSLAKSFVKAPLLFR